MTFPGNHQNTYIREFYVFAQKSPKTSDDQSEGNPGTPTTMKDRKLDTGKRKLGV